MDKFRLNFVCVGTHNHDNILQYLEALKSTSLVEERQHLLLWIIEVQ